LELKPMNAGEILDHTFKMVGAQFKSYLTIAALGIAPIFVFGLLALGLYGALGTTTAIIVALVAIIPIMAVAIATEAGIVRTASLQISDQSISVTEACQFGFRKAWPLFLGGLLYGLACLIGAVLLIIPGIYCGISFSLFAVAMIVEEQPPWAALGRSRKLISGSWWRVLGILFLISILVSIFRSIIYYSLALLSLQFLGHFTGQIVSAILNVALSFLFAPFSLIASTLLYYDLRIRKENLDLKVLVDNLTESGGLPAGVPS
jgi:hypothetical protein